MKRTLFLLSLLIGWTLQSAAQVEGKSVKVKGQGVYCGEVEMDVTQGADGKYYLYDSNRKICTLIGASLPSLDDLAANGTLRDYIRTEEDGPADDEEYIKEVLDAEKTFDATAYLKTGEVANSTSDFYAYQLKSITIEQLTKDGQDCIPTAESSSAMRVALYYRQSKWTPFFEQLLPDAEGAPVHDQVLIDEGTVCGFTGNRMFSQYLGLEDSFILTNWSVSGGTETAESIRKGEFLEVVEFSDFQVDSLTGDIFGEIRLAYYHDGKGQVIPVSGGSVSGSMHDNLGSMRMTKNVRRYANAEIPLATRLEKVTVTGA